MAVRLDPEGNEINALLEYSEGFEGKRVLEIGSGDGRLTWRYAHHAAHITGIDTSQDEVAKAIADMPPELADRIKFQVCGINDYVPPPGDALFDTTILAWSL